MKKIQTFEEFFETKIRPVAQNIEQKRQGYLTSYFLIYCICILLCSTLVYKFLNTDLTIGIILALWIICMLHPTACMLVTRYKSVAKSYFMNNLVTTLYGLKYFNPNPTIVSNFAASMGINQPTHHIDEERLRELCIFKNFDRVSYDDYIKGSYNDLNLEIQELSLSSLLNSKNSQGSISFHGILLSCEVKKKHNAKTVFYQNNGLVDLLDNFLGKSTSAKEVKFEDPEFNSEFKVYSTDQIEARYLFTTAFMERIKKFHKANKEYDISGEFSNGKFYLAICSGRNWFELPFFKSADEPQNYKHLVQDIDDMLGVIDTLKLEQNIGL